MRHSPPRYAFLDHKITKSYDYPISCVPSTYMKLIARFPPFLLILGISLNNYVANREPLTEIHGPLRNMAKRITYKLLSIL